MSKEFDEYIADKPEINLISKEDMAILKIKIGKSHRKEADWDIIKNILSTHDVITAEPMTKTGFVDSVEHILCEQGALFVFTNMDDCERHIQDLDKRYHNIGRYFQITSLPLADVIQIAHANEMNVFIDRQDELNSKCMVYYYAQKRIEVVLQAKN